MFFQWEYPPSGSGIGRYVSHMAQALDAAGHSVFIVTSRVTGLPDEDAMGSCGRVYRVYETAQIGRDEPAQIALELARRHAVDVIEVPDHLGEASGLFARRKRPPVLIKAHYNDVFRVARYAQAVYAWQRPMIDLACWRDWRRLRRERKSLEGPEALTVCSSRLLEGMLEQGIRLPSKRTVIPNPISPIPDWYNTEAEQPTLLLVGRMDIGKGIQYLPGLLDRLIPHFPEVRLEIAGGDGYARGLGSLRMWLERQLGARSHRVRFLGMLDAHDLDAAYRRAWVVLVPSRWDTFPTVVLEAMTRGKSMVGSTNGGIPEMLAGTLCPVESPDGPAYADAVIRLLSDRGLRKTVGESGKEKARMEYAPGVIVKRYIQFVETIV